MNEWINTGQPPLSEEYLEQVRTAIRDTLEKTEKGGIAGSISFDRRSFHKKNRKASLEK